MAELQNGSWSDWLEEAQLVIGRWETRRGRILMVLDAAALVEEIARALHAAAERGRPKT